MGTGLTRAGEETRRTAPRNDGDGATDSDARARGHQPAQRRCERASFGTPSRPGPWRAGALGQCAGSDGGGAGGTIVLFLQRTASRI